MPRIFRTFPSHFAPIFLALVMSLLFWACSSRISQAMLDRQKEVYERATEEILANGGAQVVDTDLDPVLQAELDGEGKLMVVAWKSAHAANDYYEPVGTIYELTSDFLTWVVQVSEYEEKAHALKLDRLKGQALALRLEQLLGLPPEADTTKVFMVMKVRGEDLFRPCRDPDIADCACSLNFPGGYYAHLSPYDTVYEGLVESQKGFPWTRMGYTFDWRARSRDHFGLSEYIIRQGAEVEIMEKTRTEEWLQGLE